MPRTRLMGGEYFIGEVAKKLVSLSAYFEVTPLPYDVWEVRVKKGDEDVLQRAAAGTPKKTRKEAR